MVSSTPSLSSSFHSDQFFVVNLVERWFRELTDKAVRRGSFVSVPNLIETIEKYLAAYNSEAKPFVWTASAESILAKLKKVKAIYKTLH